MKTIETKIEVKTDSAFEVGTVYKAFTCGKGYTSYKVTARTAKFVTVENLTDGTVKRCKVDLEEKKHYLNDGYHTDEFIRPDKKAYGITPRDIDRAAMKTDEVSDTVNGKREDRTTATICLQSGYKGDVELVNEHARKGDTVSEVDKLERQFHSVQSKIDGRITVKSQYDSDIAVGRDTEIHIREVNTGIAFVDSDNVFIGHYETPAQVSEVIKLFDAAIDGGRFEFPHRNDLGKSTVELAEDLTAFLLKTVPWHAGFMDLTLQNGKAAVASPRTATVEPDWHGNGRFAFVTPWNEIFARYDTPEQVRSVIYRIKHAVEDKRDKFKYPTVTELAPPAYELKTWAIDFDVYHADSGLSAAELEDFADKLRTALTANGNVACVSLEDSVITIYGDSNGDNLTVDKIVDEMIGRGCWVEYPEDEIDPIEQLERGIERMRELDAQRAGIDDEYAITHLG